MINFGFFRRILPVITAPGISRFTIRQYSLAQMTKQSEFGRQRQANVLDFLKDILILLDRSHFQRMPRRYSLALMTAQSEFGKYRQTITSEFSKDILIGLVRSQFQQMPRLFHKL